MAPGGDQGRPPASIGERLGELVAHIDDEAAAQEESSASINQMVASIRNVAESVGRRDSSVRALGDTAEEGSRRIEAMLELPLLSRMSDTRRTV